MSNINNYLEYINDLALNDPAELVRRSETRFDNILNDITARIAGDDGREIVMLAGPSASGKTTTANKIAQKCTARGMQTYVVSLDDFYLDRDKIPRDESGKPDFETVYALDLPKFSETIRLLLSGAATDLPIFDFTTGKRSDEVRTVTLGEQDAVVVEGLHALNPLITDALPQKNLLKIYISVSSRIYNEKGKIILNKRNLRFLRRMTRDYLFRASSVENTYNLWESVRNGEDKYLFPYRDCADVKINSVHLSAPCVFRDTCLAMLENADLSGEQKKDAEELAAALRLFVPISPSLIPETSLLREFLGTQGLSVKTD
ncbi:MAG: hypothetical protein ACI4K8_07680 [Candidatus Fimenecus sp.]